MVWVKESSLSLFLHFINSDIQFDITKTVEYYQRAYWYWRGWTVNLSSLFGSELHQQVDYNNSSIIIPGSETCFIQNTVMNLEASRETRYWYTFTLLQGFLKASVLFVSFFNHLHSSSSLSISPQISNGYMWNRIYCNWNPKYYIHWAMYMMYIFFSFIIHKMLHLVSNIGHHLWAVIS